MAVLVMGCADGSRKAETASATTPYDSIMQAEGYDVVPLFKTRTGHVTVTLQVNGKPCVFLVDTGGGATLIDIDKKDKYHKYLPNEFFILANLLDSIDREQPGDKPFFKVYLLMNAVDLTCPYLRNLGINKPPKYGYSFYNNKNTLLHYVEPWDAEQRRAETLVGRMLAGSDESKIMFDNEFKTEGDKEIKKKPANAKYSFALVFQGMKFAVWIDYKQGYFYITEKVPKGSKNVFALTKRDNTIDYQAVKRTDSYMKTLVDVYYIGGIRYSSPALREAFLDVLGFL